MNIIGRRVFGLQDVIEVFVNDQLRQRGSRRYGGELHRNGASVVNPAPPMYRRREGNTLITEEEVPDTGIVQVLAFTRGEEQFLDNNGNGVFDQGLDTVLKENLPEPFIDFRPLPLLDAFCPTFPPSPFCNLMFDPDTEFEMFVDENEDGVWGIQGTVGVWDNNLLIFEAIPVTFSGFRATPVAYLDAAGTIPPGSPFAISNGSELTIYIAVHDTCGIPWSRVRRSQ